MKKASTDKDLKFTDQEFDLFQALAAIDRKDYLYFSRLTQEQKQKFTAYMLLQWASTVSGNDLISAYYVMSTDLNANKHMFNERVQQHPELQWMMLCTSSPGQGKQFHKWLPQIRSAVTQLNAPAKLKEIQDYFQKIYPGSHESDIQEVSQAYVLQQNIQHKLAQIYPGMKLTDIEILSKLTTQSDLEEYDRQSGN